MAQASAGGSFGSINTSPIGEEVLADNSIIITDSTIITQAEKENKVIGKDVLINPPGARSITVSPLIGNRNAKTASGTSRGTGKFTPSQMQSIEKALKKQNEQLQTAKASLANWTPADQANFEKYFGKSNSSDLEAARQEKIGEINRTIDLNEKMTINSLDYFIPEPIIPVDMYANQTGAKPDGVLTNNPQLGAYVIKDTDCSGIIKLDSV